MNADDIRTAVIDELTAIAPETAGQPIDARRSLREQLDIDSVDFLNLLTALNRRLGIDIPEADYAQLQTLDDTVAYLARKLAGA